MQVEHLIESLERFASLLPGVVSNIIPAQAMWRPSDGAWSILEVVTHLADEEAEDFCPRLKQTLDDPSQTWAPINPAGWAVERSYNDGDISSALSRFIESRTKNLAWLRGLESPDWSKTYAHASRPVRAGDLLVSWAAHDHLHLRQIAKREYQMNLEAGGDYDGGYAGEWHA